MASQYTGSEVKTQKTGRKTDQRQYRQRQKQHQRIRMADQV